MIGLAVVLLLGGSPGRESHSLQLVLDPPRSAMVCADTVGLTHAGPVWEFRLDSRLRLLQVTSSSRVWSPGDLRGQEDAGVSRYVLGPLPAGADTVRVVVRYEGEIPVETGNAEFSHHYNVGMTPAAIGTEGAFLGEGCFWLPRGDGALHGFRLEAHVPRGWESVSQGTLRERLPTADGVTTVWEERRPVGGLSLVAGPYQIAERRWGNVSVYAFLYESELDLARIYLDAAVDRLELYDGLLGKYPYAKFAIVENFLPTGYAMPSYTLLGRSVLRLPFIPDVSLGHEVLHNWWGNGVFVPEDGDNWCEGLTTYLADYWYEEMKNEEAARQYRHQILLDYANYVGPDDQLPLREFTGRTTPATRSIGYGKAAMLFHMLRSILGQDAFLEGLGALYRQYLWKEASWSDLSKVFSETSGQNLDWFFRQWVERSGAPVVVLAEADVCSSGVCVRLQQQTDPYRLLVPLTIRGDGDATYEEVWLSGPESSYTLAANVEPAEVVVDEDFDLFRLLSHEEVPPALGRALADSQSVFVVLQEDARDVAAPLALLGQPVVVQVRPPPGGVSSPSVIVGVPSESWLPYLASLCPSGTTIGRDGFSVGEHTGTWEKEALVAALRSPPGGPGAVAVVLGRVETLRAVQRKLQHYGKYGYLVVREGSVAVKGQWEADTSPLRRRLAPIERSTSKS
jgi:aminopeptidase N